MNRANLQCEIKELPAGGLCAHRVVRVGRHKRRSHGDRVGSQCDCQFQNRNCATMARSYTRIGDKFLWHRSCLYAERQQDISARATARALIKPSGLGPKIGPKLSDIQRYGPIRGVLVFPKSA